MDDLLADDIKQNEQVLSEEALARQKSNPLSDRGSGSRKKQQLSEIGQNNKNRVSIQMDTARSASSNRGAQGAGSAAKRDQKAQEKNGQAIQNLLFKSLAPAEPKESPLVGPLAGKF